MSPDITRIIDERFKQLPNVVRDFITSDTYVDHVQSMSKTYSLKPDEEDAFKTEVILALLALESPSDLVGNIARALPDRSAEDIRLILLDVERMFMPVQDALFSFIEERGELESNEGTSRNENGSGFEIESQEKKPLLEHLDQFEKRKQEKREQEQQQGQQEEGTTKTSPQLPTQPNPQADTVPPNLPVAAEDKVEVQTKQAPTITPEEKTRPAGPDPYREPIE